MLLAESSGDIQVEAVDSVFYFRAVLGRLEFLQSKISSAQTGQLPEWTGYLLLN